MNFRTASVYVWVVVLLACGELALQCRAHKRGWDAPLFRAAVASATTVVVDKPARHGPTAEFPFRSDIVSRQCGDHILRLWVASASHAEDIYLDVDQTFPAQAGRMLNAMEQSGPRWQVLNASRAGNLVPTNTADLARLGPEWRPNVVVLYQMSMEIVDLSRKYLGAAPVTGKDDGEEPAAGPPARTQGVIAKAAAETTTYTTLKANVTPWFAGQRVLADELGDAAEQDFEERIHNFLREAERLGAVPVLCTFATSDGLDDADRLPGDVRQFMLRYNRYLSPRGWARSIARFNAAIRRIAAEEGVTLVDCEKAMTGQASYFRDYVHFTPAGHQRVAELLSEKVLGLSVSPGRPHPSPLPEGSGTGKSGQRSVGSGQFSEGHARNRKSKIQNPKSARPHPSPLPEGEGIDSRLLAPRESGPEGEGKR